MIKSDLSGPKTDRKFRGEFTVEEVPRKGREGRIRKLALEREEELVR